MAYVLAALVAAWLIVVIVQDAQDSSKTQGQAIAPLSESEELLVGVWQHVYSASAQTISFQSNRTGDTAEASSLGVQRHGTFVWEVVDGRLHIIRTSGDATLVQRQETLSPYSCDGRKFTIGGAELYKIK